MRESLHALIGTRKLVRIKAKIDGKIVKGSLARVKDYAGEGFYILQTVPDQRELIVKSEDIF